MMALASSVVPLLEDRRAPTAKDDRCGCGCLIVTRDSRRFTLPLRAVSFAASVAERVAEVTVEQTFENVYDELLEAVYIFPLPGGAAVSRFELHVDGKRLVGIVEERGEARRQYDQAIAQGKKAALLEQERDDVFTVKVGNLPPRSIATVKMVYSERLPAFDDGETELRIPLVVAPRYIPGQPLERASLGDGTESDSTSVPDASRISPPRLAPGLRGDVALAISIELLSEDSVDELGCTQHATKLAGAGGRATIALARKDELLDRDFVLRWRTAAAEEKPVLLVARKGGECYGLLSLVPPRDVREGQGARDVVFLIDRSGSMAGAKMDSAKRAVARLMRTLQPHDRFALCVFSDTPTWFMEGFSAADPHQMQSAQGWLQQRGAAGGTELDAALSGCFDLFESSSNVMPAGGMKKVKPQVTRMPILVLVTDGEVGNESEILRRIEGRLANVRVFTLGIDTAVNASFLRRLAQLGRGTSTFCAPGADLEAALARIGKEIGTPVLLDIEIEDQGLGFDQGSITPERLPDLFAGRTASIFFKCRPGMAGRSPAPSSLGQVRVRAKRAEGGVFEQVVSAQLVDMAALSQLWAKSRISDLEDRYRLAYGGAGGGLEASRAEILGIALEHQLLTRFTAFIVIDHSEVEARLARRKIVQAVETPAEWAKAEEAPRPITGRFMPSANTASMPPGSAAKKMGPMPSAPPAPKPSVGRPLSPPSATGRTSDVRRGGGAPPPPPAKDSFDMLDIDADDRMGSAEAFSALEGGPPPAAARFAASDPFAAPADPFGAPAADPFGDADAFADGAAGGASFDGGRRGGDPFGPPVGGGVAGGGVAGRGRLDEDEMAPPPPPPPPSRRIAASRPPARSAELDGKAGMGRTPPPRMLATVVDELGKELAAVLAALDRGEWPQDGGARLGALREECILALRASQIAHVATRTAELLGTTLASLLTALQRRKGKPVDLVHAVRAASEALAAQCRSELAPLLGSGGSPWEASI